MWLVAHGQRVGLGATVQRVEPQSDWLTPFSTRFTQFWLQGYEEGDAISGPLY